MNQDEFEKLFKEYDEKDYGEFTLIQDPPSKRHDLCAFLLLDKLVPESAYGDGLATEILAASGHDESWLDVNMDCLRERITAADILYLVRCGIRYDEENDSLALFV